MPAAQIYQVANTLAKNLTGGNQTVVDATSFAVFAANAFNGGVEPVYNEMIDLIGKTIIAIDEAEDDERGIIVDAFDYGIILQKLSFQTQDSQTNSDFDINGSMVPENPYTVQGKQGIIQKFFEQCIPTFCYEDVAYDKQIREAFHGPETLAGFLEGLYTRMRNAYKVAKLGLSDAAIGALVAHTYNDTTDVNYGRRVRKLLTEFKTLYTDYASITKNEAMVLPQYLEYVRKQILIDKKNLNKLTHLYNEIGASGSEVPIDRRTPEGNLKLDLSLSLTTCYAKYYGDTFNESYVQFPKHTEVVNWGIATAPDTVKVSLDAGQTTITVSDILGLMYDRDAVVATMDRSRFVNMYDQWNDRNVFKLTCDRRYVVDPTENAILYLNA